jgi:hypothetical protein
MEPVPEAKGVAPEMQHLDETWAERIHVFGRLGRNLSWGNRCLIASIRPRALCQLPCGRVGVSGELLCTCQQT